ncbi:MAG: HAD family hydrolase [Salaquimonas sp.]|nr:HAD family hydrolase [Salaquimonas sp.]
MGILFDKDGTLLDFEATYGTACANIVHELAEGDEECAARLAEAAGFDLSARRFSDDSIIIAGSAMTLADLWAPFLGVAASPDLARRFDDMFAHHSSGSVMVFDGVGNVLGDLAARGLPLGIATNDSEEGGRAHAEIAGISGHFSFYAGHDSGHGAKPDPGMVLAFAGHCECPPERIVMVGDSLHDMHAARAAGAIGVAVTTGPAGREQLAPHADYVIDNLAELTGLPPLSGY